MPNEIISIEGIQSAGNIFFLSVILAFALANNNYIEKIEGPLHTLEIRQPDKTTQQHQFSFLSTPLKS